MRQSTDKKASTLRFTPETKYLLARAAHLLRMSESQIAEEALLEYFKQRNLNVRYVLNVTKTHHVVLMREGDNTSVIEVSDRNGVPPEAVQQLLAAKLRAPVDLVIDEGERP